ncbi:hypothetical protein EDD18DRAFT_1101820 [Armillaria luteobubalina]|uniref:Uncharacterized protein n=1 Tax=Armillaria luteobubalina TaxID=153913 RepID=A0AA39QDG8_9AGAR|nr:hypothetical protein EDD18DRAFT_1101820 [Armillaria luteobubalina]
MSRPTFEFGTMARQEEVFSSLPHNNWLSSAAGCWGIAKLNSGAGAIQSACFYSGWFWLIRTSTHLRPRMLTWTDTRLRKGWCDLPIGSFNSVRPSEVSSSSPSLELEDAKNQVHSVGNPAQCGRLSPFSFKEWLQHVDENWGVRPRTWQEAREKDLADEVAAAHILAPNITPLSLQDLFLRDSPKINIEIRFDIASKIHS